VRITFIRPRMIGGKAGDACEPRVFALLAGLTPAGVECVLHDERLEPVPLDQPTDLVALSVDTFSARRAYQLATEYHQRGIPVVLGGHHPTLAPDEALCFAHTVVSGDAEGVWPRLVEDARAGRLQRRYESRLPAPIGNAVDRRVFAGKAYRRISMVEFGRGCPHACDFCSVHAFYESTHRRRPVRDVVAELASLGGRHVFFTDDNLFAEVAPAQELLQALQPARVRWSCQTSLEVAAHPEVLRQMAESGCCSVTVGFESLVPENLEQMGKGWNARCGRFADLVARCRDHGIMVYGTFVFGYDHDTPDVFARTVEFAVQSKLFLANFNPLTPTPGTALYERLRQERRLLRARWWLDPQYRYGDALFRPRQMTAEQLAEGCYRAKTEFNRAGCILQRALDGRANAGSLCHVGLFLTANLISRREIHRKQGQALGSEAPLLPPFGELPP
jgi:radical SAM superfamily enzyme YgiQ (UPF0313 family)